MSVWHRLREVVHRVMPILALLLPMLRAGRPFARVVHGLTAITLVLVLYIASQTGAIHSAALVWLTVLTVPVLLLLGPKATLAWMAIQLLSLLALWGLTRQEVFDAHPMLSEQAVAWAMMNHVLVLGSLMLALRVQEHRHLLQRQQIERRNEELRQIHEALIQAQVDKDEFVAAVGHELRTPMNAILGFNGVLREALADRPEQTEAVEQIRRSTEQLLQVVNDILDFSQLQAGQMSLVQSDVDLHALLEELARRHQERAHDKGLVLEGDFGAVTGLHVRLDRQRLQQVLDHLLANAIQFTCEGRVSVRVQVQGPCLRFDIEDTGCGIAQERQPRLFRRFEHAERQTHRTHGGTGLGLSLCEGLVHLQGGEIGVRSQVGQGALFWVKLPWVPALGPALPGGAGQVLPPTAVLNILLVDDNPVNLMVAQLQLQKLWPQAHIVTANSGEEALLNLASQRFDVAVFDLVMPGMDGLQLTREVRERFPGIAAHMPILALTANTHPAERERCMAAGMDEVLHKPIEAEALLRAVSRLMPRSRE